jgi:hypothetical protein
MKTTLHSVTWKKKFLRFLALRYSTRSCSSTTLRNKYKKIGGEREGTNRERKERKTNVLYFDVLFHVHNVQRTP